MAKEQCRGRHVFVPDVARFRELLSSVNSEYLWKCDRCGYEMDVNTPREEYDKSYFNNMSSAWDPEAMHKSEIASFEISYLIAEDRYQIFKYNSRKLVYKKTWGVRPFGNMEVDKEADFQKPHELFLTEEEDREIHSLLENTDFESWETDTKSLLTYAMGIINVGENRLPNFECTFKDCPHVYYKEFPNGPYGQDVFESLRNLDKHEEYDLVELLVRISKDHGIDLPSFCSGYIDFLL